MRTLTLYAMILTSTNRDHQLGHPGLRVLQLAPHEGQIPMDTATREFFIIQSIFKLHLA
jgi:hypothetical protein